MKIDFVNKRLRHRRSLLQRKGLKTRRKSNGSVLNRTIGTLKWGPQSSLGLGRVVGNIVK